MSFRRRQLESLPDWWRQVAYAGTKLLYQPEPKPVVYIIPVKNILGRLALVPYGAHGTIPYDWHPLRRSHYPRGMCDAQDRPGSGSRLFYINSWAMIWSSDHARSGLDSAWEKKKCFRVHMCALIMCLVYFSVCSVVIRALLCVYVLWCTLCSLVHFMLPETLKRAYLSNKIIGSWWTKEHTV